jgi:asparaginyl-tRNA synthetase
MVHNYPKTVKPFYMKLDEDGKTVQSFDILVPEVGEIVGGSQREERLEVLQARIKEMGLKEEMYWWYLDLRRYGTVPHGGYGVGFERLVMMICGLQNIREASAFPRVPGNAEF